MRARWRQYGVAAAFAALTFAPGCESAATAQTLEYFSAPLARQPASPNETDEGRQNGTERAGDAYYGRRLSNLYEQALAQSRTTAPPWLLTEHVGVDEVFTDNVEGATSHERSDLGSLFSAGGTLTGDTPYLRGIVAATGTYRRYINDTGLDRVSGYGFTNAVGTVAPGSLYFRLNGLMDEVSREGLGLQNPLVQVSPVTQIFEISGTPLFYDYVDHVGMNLLRYEIGQVWFVRNTRPIQEQGLNLGALSDTTGQTARDDFMMAGTIVPRLLSDISLSGSSSNSTSGGAGNFVRERGQIINEYALTRRLFAVGAAGYERLHDGRFPNVDGEGPTWSAGARYVPNANSYALLTYGRHDLKSDFAGEVAWSVTPLTHFYADYTDSILTAQQFLLGHNDESEVGPEGILSRVSFNESPVVSTLDDQLLTQVPGPMEPAPVHGVPLSEINNALSLENALFRTKALFGTVVSVLDDTPIQLTVKDLNRIQLTELGSITGLIGRKEHSHGVTLSWTRPLMRQFYATLTARYDHLDVDQIQSATTGGINGDQSAHFNQYGASLDLRWKMTDTLTGFVRYDYLHHDGHVGLANYPSDQNALTIGLRKAFY